MGGRINLEQRLKSFAGLREFVPRDQHLHIFAARFVMVRHHGQYTGIERFGIIQHISHMANLREQAHRFWMIAKFKQEAADLHFGLIDLAIPEKHFGLNDRWRNACKMRDVLGCNLRTLCVTRHPVKSNEHMPAH